MIRRRAHFLFGICVCLGGLTASGCGAHDGKSPPTASIAGTGDAQAHPATAPANLPAHDKSHPLVVIHTSAGDITLRLDAAKAPITVDNFLSYIDQGHYDNTLIHQVLAKPAVILGGGYDTFGKERPTGLPIRNEAHNGRKRPRHDRNGPPRRSDRQFDQPVLHQLHDNPGMDPKANGAGGRRPRQTDRPLRTSGCEQISGSTYGYCVFGTVIGRMERGRSDRQIARSRHTAIDEHSRSSRSSCSGFTSPADHRRTADQRLLAAVACPGSATLRGPVAEFAGIRIAQVTATKALCKSCSARCRQSLSRTRCPSRAVVSWASMRDSNCVLNVGEPGREWIAHSLSMTGEPIVAGRVRTQSANPCARPDLDSWRRCTRIVCSV